MGQPIRGAATGRMTQRECLTALVEGAAIGPRDITVAVLTEMLEHYGAGMPSFIAWQEHVRRDALFWAETATMHEREAYGLAAIKEIERRKLAVNMAKRLLIAAWNALPPQDRAAFLKHVGGDYAG